MDDIDKIVEDAYIMTYRKLLDLNISYEDKNEANAMGIFSNYVKQLCTTNSYIKGIKFSRYLKLKFFSDYFLVIESNFRHYLPSDSFYMKIQEALLKVTSEKSKLYLFKSGILIPERFDYNRGVSGFVENFVKNYKP